MELIKLLVIRLSILYTQLLYPKSHPASCLFIPIKNTYAIFDQMCTNTNQKVKLCIYGIVSDDTASEYNFGSSVQVFGPGLELSI